MGITDNPIVKLNPAQKARLDHDYEEYTKRHNLIMIEHNLKNAKLNSEEIKE